MEKFINSPYIKQLCGIIQMVTSGKEVIDSFMKAYKGGGLKRSELLGERILSK